MWGGDSNLQWHSCCLILVLVLSTVSVPGCLVTLVKTTFLGIILLFLILCMCSRAKAASQRRTECLLCSGRQGADLACSCMSRRQAPATVNKSYGQPERGTAVPQQNFTSCTSLYLHFSRFPGIELHFMNGNEAGNMNGESGGDDLAITPGWSLCTFYTGSLPFPHQLGCEND